MTSSQMRDSELFMRNSFEGTGKWGIPLIKKQDIDFSDVHLLACSDTKANERPEYQKYGVHFFVDDYRFEGIYDQPQRSFKRLSQYSFLLSPDHSQYANMKPWRQIESVAHNRWVGAWWQSRGLKVVATISWSTPSSFEYSFEGVEEHAPVAVGMIGSKQSRFNFMRGYDAMLERLNPSVIICLGKPYDEMRGNLIVVDYMASRKKVR